MTIAIDKAYRKEKLLDYERKSLVDEVSVFSFSKRSTWLTFTFIILAFAAFSFIMPFIPPRYGWTNWMPPTTGYEYQHRLISFIIATPIIIFIVFVYAYTRIKIDLVLGIKWTGNFKITQVINLGKIKFLFMNGWRPFSIREKQPYFHGVIQGQIITIKRSGTYRLIDYCIRDEATYKIEHEKTDAN